MESMCQILIFPKIPHYECKEYRFCLFCTCLGNRGNSSHFRKLLISAIACEICPNRSDFPSYLSRDTTLTRMLALYDPIVKLNTDIERRKNLKVLGGIWTHDLLLQLQVKISQFHFMTYGWSSLMQMLNCLYKGFLIHPALNRLDCYGAMIKISFFS